VTSRNNDFPSTKENKTEAVRLSPLTHTAKPRVLWLMQYAPHYREALLRALGERFELTVSCVPCAAYSLVAPESRTGYTYLERGGLRIGSFWFLDELSLAFNCGAWDVVVCVEDLHHPLRYLWYLAWMASRRRRVRRWVWWGHFVGRRDWRLLGWFRRVLVNSSNGAITYTEEVRRRLLDSGCRAEQVVSSNNTVVSELDFDITPVPAVEDTLNLLYVGRNHARKRLERLIALVCEYSSLRVRLVGPGVQSLAHVVEKNGVSDRADLCEPTVGSGLADHFHWAHCVVAPGHVGLLVTDAARFGRPIIVDSSSLHAPEACIAREAEQPFLDWSASHIPAAYFREVLAGCHDLQRLADRLVETVRADYTIEVMTERFSSMICGNRGPSAPNGIS